MNPNCEELLFQLALEKPAEKRAAFLDAMCEGDAALRQRLDALLAAHEQPATELAGDADRRDEFHESLLKGSVHPLRSPFICSGGLRPSVKWF